MVKLQGKGLLPVGSALLALVVVVGYWRSLSSRDVPALSAPSDGALGSDVPEIALARIDKPGSHGPLGRRDIFRYGAAVVPADPVLAQSAKPTPPPVTLPPAPKPVVASLPPLNVHFIGTVEVQKRGLVVAVLVTDQKEVLTGQAGDIVANRFRIVRIGRESVDVQDMGSDSVRRIPLGGS